MTAIKKKPALIQKLLGKQRVIPSDRYRLLSFCIVVSYSGGRYIYNTLTKELASLSAVETAALAKKSIAYVDEVRDLIENWMLVPISYNDKGLADSVQKFFSALQTENHISNYTIMTTTDCNARCFYCYEMGRSRIPMTKETAHKVAKFITDNVNAHVAHITWFGGEPLYNQEVIDIICSDLQINQVRFDSFVVTNGYLFNESVILQAKSNWNIKGVQITLDGTEEVYNKTKAYTDKGANAYSRVLTNIKCLLDNGISVTIRLNIGEYNADDILVLCRELAERFKGYKKFGIYTALLMDYSDDKQINEFSNALVDKYFAINDFLYEQRINTQTRLKSKVQYHRCMADGDHSVLIAPDGGIGKCEHFSDSDFWRTLDDATINEGIINSWKERVYVDDCKECLHYPLCFKLKKCPDDMPACHAYDREIRDYHLVESIKATIREYEKENEI